MKYWKTCMLFALGGTAYFTLECVWRGFSCGSMFLLGGLCFLLIGKIGQTALPLAAQLLLSAAMVTALELLTGLAVNRDYSVWDYRALTCNFLGQICLIFSLLWLPVSFAGLALYCAAERRLERLGKL
ncbi:MAG: putative ABC transporter permease [Firmicutes bacterium]|nr:putative ABC transporter permease [Bacillota bacterium]